MSRWISGGPLGVSIIGCRAARQAHPLRLGQGADSGLTYHHIDPEPGATSPVHTPAHRQGALGRAGGPHLGYQALLSASCQIRSWQGSQGEGDGRAAPS